MFSYPSYSTADFPVLFSLFWVFYMVRLFLQECRLTILFLFHYSLKHPTKYVGKKTRKYVIPAKPITPLHLRAQQQQQAAGQADQQAVASGGQGSGPQGGSEVQMYRETSSGGLHGTPYNKVKPTKHSFILMKVVVIAYIFT